MADKSELLPGTLDMLVLRVLSRGDLHGWGITSKLEQLSRSALQVDEGSLYPALYRMEDKGWIEAEWKLTENTRRAKYYRLTRAGRKQLETEQVNWDRMSAVTARVLHSARGSPPPFGRRGPAQERHAPPAPPLLPPEVGGR